VGQCEAPNLLVTGSNECVFRSGESCSCGGYIINNNQWRSCGYSAGDAIVHTKRIDNIREAFATGEGRLWRRVPSSAKEWYVWHMRRSEHLGDLVVASFAQPCL
jgi:hypothetical protein